MSIQTLIHVSAALRGAHPDIERIFTEGGCYEYFRALNFIEPRLEPYYLGAAGHVAGRLDNSLIDITGVLDCAPSDDGVYPLAREPRLMRAAPGWRENAWKT